MKSVAQVASIFVAAFFLAIGNQVLCKKRLMSEYRAKKKIFKRWANEDQEMITADRMVANLMEWATIFWPVFAINVAVSGAEGGHHISAGLVYVCARLLYVVLGLTMVIPSSGQVNNSRMMFATIPGYAGLLYLVGEVFRMAL